MILFGLSFQVVYFLQPNQQETILWRGIQVSLYEVKNKQKANIGISQN